MPEFEIGVADLTLLEQVDESHLVDNLNRRYSKDKIYTSIGDVIVSLNPYKNVDIYGTEIVNLYRGKNMYEMPPHIYCIADRAYKNMKDKSQDQCIIITGESGAGKTEASKIIMKYIAAVSTSTEKVDKIKQQLLNCNPCLEAFGNSKTAKNDNSSRFGKYMDLQFDFKGDPIGGKITTYLLEKSRVVHQAEGERSFHIFYQILNVDDEELKKTLLLNDTISNSVYIQEGSGLQLSSMKDREDFLNVINAMDAIGISSSDRNFMFQCVASILHLGTVSFTPDESDPSSSNISNDISKKGIENAASLIGISTQTLLNILTKRTVKDNKRSGQDFTVSLDVEKASSTRDALAKALYGRLFQFLVKRINGEIHHETNQRSNLIGVLDIYGFEVIAKNGFEQFCINYCNEKLQQLFIELTLKSEQDEYANEGLAWTHIEFFNNNVICDLIEAKHRGIFALLDEECMRPGDVTDMTFLTKLNSMVIKHAHFESREKLKSDKTLDTNMFRLKHYASTVTYTVEAFIEKNTDNLFKDVLYGLNSSMKSEMKEMFPENPQNGDLKRPDTIGIQFRNSIQQLIENLLSKNHHYLRCIKPNDSKKADEVDENLLQHQCRYLGLLENIKIRRAGYCYRQKYDKFLQRYKMLSKSTWPNISCPIQEAIFEIMKFVQIGSNEFAFGTSKLFIKSPKTIFLLETARSTRCHSIADKIRAHWLGYIARKRYRIMKENATKIKATYKMFTARKDYMKKLYYCLTLTKVARGFIARTRFKVVMKKQPKRAAPVIQRFWRNKLYRDFLMFAAKDAITLAGSRWREIQWPQGTVSTRNLSSFLKKLYIAQMARKYRLNLTAERKDLLEIKAVASNYCSKKSTYMNSVFQTLVGDTLNIQDNPKWKVFLNEGILASFLVEKRNRSEPNKVKIRSLILTKKMLHVLEGKCSSLKESQKLETIQGVTMSSLGDGLIFLRIKDASKGDYLYNFVNSNEVFEFTSRLYLAVKNCAQKPIAIEVQDGFQAKLMNKTVKVRFQKAAIKSSLEFKRTKDEVKITVRE